MNNISKFKSSDIRAFSVSEAARYACVSRSTIDNWILQGQLPYEELRGRGKHAYRFRRIRRKDLDEFLNKFYKIQKRRMKKM